MDYSGNTGTALQPIYLCSVRDKAEHEGNQTDCIYILHSFTPFKRTASNSLAVYFDGEKCEKNFKRGFKNPFFVILYGETNTQAKE